MMRRRHAQREAEVRHLRRWRLGLGVGRRETELVERVPHRLQDARQPWGRRDDQYVVDVTPQVAHGMRSPEGVQCGLQEGLRNERTRSGPHGEPVIEVRTSREMESGEGGRARIDRHLPICLHEVSNGESQLLLSPRGIMADALGNGRCDLKNGRETHGRERCDVHAPVRTQQLPAEVKGIIR